MSSQTPEALTYLRTVIGKRPGEEARANVMGAAFLYLFKGTSVPLEQEVTRFKAPGAEWRLRSFQKLARYDGDLLRDHKAFTYEQVVGVTQTTYKLSPQVKQVVANALGYKPLLVRLKGYQREGYRPLTSRAYDQAITAALQSEDLNTYIAKFVARKMAFITASAGIPAAEIASDLKEAAMYALLRAYPAWSNLGHLLAIAKVAIHNRGINFIHERVAQSRAHLQRASNGDYSAVNVSLSHFTDEASAGASLAEAGDQAALVSLLDGSKPSDHVFPPDMLESVRQLVTGNTLRPRQREYLKLLLGFEDTYFSAYLGECNNDYAFRVGFDVYHAKVCEFLDVPVAKGLEFLQSLRRYL